MTGLIQVGVTTAQQAADIINNKWDSPNATATASEALTAGDFVHLFSEEGVLYVRKADATLLFPADGFVRLDVLEGAPCNIQGLGLVNNYLSGLTLGSRYWLSTTVPGRVQITPPNQAGKLYQQLGVALTSTSMLTSNGLALELG